MGIESIILFDYITVSERYWNGMKYVKQIPGSECALTLTKKAYESLLEFNTNARKRTSKGKKREK